MGKKLSFRAKAIDPNRRMPIFTAEELVGVSDYVSINRELPQMPTGMEKDEEKEVHLQQVIWAQQRQSNGESSGNAVVIPIPKVSENDSNYDRLYPPVYKPPKQYIKVDAINLEPELPEYDLDSEDESWLQSQEDELPISPLQFERITDTLEKQSEYQVIKPETAKLLLRVDDDVLLAVYDYWLSKRYIATTQGKQLIPRVKSEKRENGSNSSANSYVAFRRRAEKMQTRKNRRNDEESYGKILQLREELENAVTLAEMVKRREKNKRELIHLRVEIVERRWLLNDFTGAVLFRAMQEVKPSFRFNEREIASHSSGRQGSPTTKRKQGQLRNDGGITDGVSVAGTSKAPRSSVNDHQHAANPYGFKRMRGCRYYVPAQDEDLEFDDSGAYSKYLPGFLQSRNASDSVAVLQFVGLVRHRMGRGGRYILDRKRVGLPAEEQQLDPPDDTSSLPAKGLYQSDISKDASTQRRVSVSSTVNYFGLPTPSPSPNALESDIDSKLGVREESGSVFPVEIGADQFVP